MRIIKTDRAITHALAKLLRTKSIDTITVTELCQIANINRKTFYMHFYTMDEVLEFILNTISEHYYQIQESTHQQGIYDLTRAVNEMLRLIQGEIEYCRDLACGTEYHRILSYCIQMSVDIRLLFIDEKTASDPVVQRVQHFMNGGYITTILDWLRASDDMDYTELANISNDLFRAIREKYPMDIINE